MEILNNIWMAISTPNQLFVDLINFFGTFIENFLTMSLFLTIFNIKSSSKQKFIYWIIIPIIGTISIHIIPTPFNIFFNYLSMIIISHYTFKISILKSILAIITSAIIFALVGTLISNPYIRLLHISSNIIETVPIYKFFFLTLIFTILAIIIFILKLKDYKFNPLEHIDKNNKIIILSNLLLGLITLVVQAIITFYYIDRLPIIITFLSFITLCLYFTLSIYSLTKALKLTLVTRKLESAEEYNNTLRILHDNVRGFKHDFDNIVTTIGGYVKTNDMEGLKKYYVQLEDDCQRVNNLYVLNPDIVNNDGIYNLITKKYHEAEEKDIKVNITFLLDLSTLKMKIYEFARILGILLDNAIEASSECEDKIINLVFRNDEKNSRQIILIENTYSNKEVDTEKIFEKGISEKENHTGLGLWEVRKILKKNNNINLFTTKNEKYFSQQLEIYYK